MTKAEKIKAVVLGHAVADALGVPVEFCSREELRSSPVKEMRGYGTYAVPAGCFSDDTSMALAALDSLSSGKVDFTDVMERFCAWYYEDAYTPTGELFDVGGTSARAIENYREKGLPLAECAPRTEHDNGNGALMRIYPFVLFAWARGLSEEDTLALVREGSALTHGHERALLADEIYALVLLALLDKPQKASVRAALTYAKEKYGERAEYAHFTRILEEDPSTLPQSAIRSTGYVVDTIEAALFCLLTTENYRECVLRAVNLGDDTDTVAAVAGALAGALYGCSAIPTAWLTLLKKRDEIEALCDAAACAWA